MVAELFLRAEKITKYFGASCALDSVSLEMRSSEVTCVQGANGAGKSTLLRCLAGVLGVDKGVVEYFDPTKTHKEQITKARAKPLIGYVAKELMLYADLSIKENLSLFLKLAHGVSYSKKRLEEVVFNTAEEFQLQEFLDKKISHCSQGLQRRATIARAFISEPKLLLLDEPFANLDLQSKNDLSEILNKQKQKGASILVVSHETFVQEQLEARVLIIENGKLLISDQ